jgi:hypothetical protein
LDRLSVEDRLKSEQPETAPMSMDHLRDLAGKLLDHREQQLKQGFVGPNMEAKLLAEAFPQAVQVIAELESRVAALELKAGALPVSA